jgi:hypothetical protein
LESATTEAFLVAVDLLRPEATNRFPYRPTLWDYVDLEIFYPYIWQEFGKYAEYQRNTVFLLAAEGMDEVMVIAPRTSHCREDFARKLMARCGSGCSCSVDGESAGCAGAAQPQRKWF